MNYDANNPYSVLDYILKYYGIDVFKGKKLIVILKKLAPNLVDERHIIERLSKKRILEKLVDSRYDSQSKQQSIVDKSVEILRNKEHLPKEIIQNYLKLFLELFNYNSSIQINSGRSRSQGGKHTPKSTNANTSQNFVNTGQVSAKTTTSKTRQQLIIIAILSLVIIFLFLVYKSINAVPVSKEYTATTESNENIADMTTSKPESASASTPVQTTTETTQQTPKVQEKTETSNESGLDLGEYIGTDIYELAKKFPDLKEGSNSSTGYIGFKTPSDTVVFSSNNGDHLIDNISVENNYDYSIYGLKCGMDAATAKSQMNKISDDWREIKEGDFYLEGTIAKNQWKPWVYVRFHQDEAFLLNIDLPDAKHAINNSSPDFIFPDSSSRYITEAELDKLSREEVGIARNEISARHGRKFQKQKLQDYFNSKSWYSPSYEPQEFDDQVTTILNDTEIRNMEFIKDYEQKKGYSDL